jgi:protein-tyrosine phosphatase
MTSTSGASPYIRLLTVAGASNFRDWGGYPTHSGALTRSRWLFRSAHLGSLTSQGITQFRELGVRTIIDLRGPRERELALPHFAVGLGVKVISCPIRPGSRESVRAAESIQAQTPEQLRELMRDIYRSLVREEMQAVGLALRAILQAADQPLVVHCAAGKDRTGFLVATVHSLLGVTREAMMQDYLLTNTHWDRQTLSGFGELRSELKAAIQDADASYLNAAFAALHTDYASVDEFAVLATGITDFGAQLRARLLIATTQQVT